jgi:hypothetical protein
MPGLQELLCPGVHAKAIARSHQSGPVSDRVFAKGHRGSAWSVVLVASDVAALVRVRCGSLAAGGFSRCRRGSWKLEELPDT